MKTNSPFTKIIVLLAWIALAVPQAVAQSPTFEQRVPRAPLASEVVDIQLDAGGLLVGRVVDQQGHGIPNMPVVLLKGSEIVVRAKSDEFGGLRMHGVPSGSYLIASSASIQGVRLWAPATGPPVARDQVLLVSQADAVRGQFDEQPNYYDLISRRAVLTSLVIAGLIVVPIVIWGDDDDAS